MTFNNEENNILDLIEYFFSFLNKFMMFIYIDKKLFLIHKMLKIKIKLNNNSKYFKYNLYKYIKINFKCFLKYSLFIVNKLTINRYTYKLV